MFNLMLTLEMQVTSLRPKRIAVISAAFTVDDVVMVCFLVPMLIGPPFGKKRKS